ncbi:hypothetical protein K443DRAFT_126413 [Laccaria amethystina LaAM-08-1]|uniref:Uncharacterized protein n=1 Tax=Laccaria amethystina LaAM-08-1 TaxID=1095629 RepID=A0A0C9WH95_9AGAR|nr:hypothetical protein K443DRAFT_126413 [Laccaria amethystina LaAM-08-1]
MLRTCTCTARDWKIAVRQFRGGSYGFEVAMRVGVGVKGFGSWDRERDVNFQGEFVGDGTVKGRQPTRLWILLVPHQESRRPKTQYGLERIFGSQEGESIISTNLAAWSKPTYQPLSAWLRAQVGSELAVLEWLVAQQNRGSEAKVMFGRGGSSVNKTRMCFTGIRVCSEQVVLGLGGWWQQAPRHVSWALKIGSEHQSEEALKEFKTRRTSWLDLVVAFLLVRMRCDELPDAL